MPEGGNEWVRDLLRVLPEPSMPADVSIRIQQAIAAEQGSTLGDELAARRERNRRLRGAPMWAGAAAAAAVVAAVVIPSIAGGDNGHRDQTIAGDAAAGAAESAVAPQLGSAPSSKLVPTAPGIVSGSHFTASSLPGDVQRLLAAVGADRSALSSTTMTAPAPNSAPTSGGGSGTSADMGYSSGSTGSGGSTSNGSSAAPIDPSCLQAVGAGGSVVATDFGYWNGEPAYLIVVDDPSFPDTYTAHVVATECTGSDTHQLYEEKVARQ